MNDKKNIKNITCILLYLFHSFVLVYTDTYFSLGYTGTSLNL